MLRIYDVSLQVAADVASIAKAISVHDADLARQLRRASASIALNLAEGSVSRGGNKTSRYATALGSTRETRACIEVALRIGYINVPKPEVLDRLDRIAATLYNLTRTA